MKKGITLFALLAAAFTLPPYLWPAMAQISGKGEASIQPRGWITQHYDEAADGNLSLRQISPSGKQAGTRPLWVEQAMGRAQSYLASLI